MRRMPGDLTKAVAALVLSAGAASGASAQHATASDVLDGARAYSESCAGCHGPDGNLIAGIDFGRGVFRRPLSDGQIAEIIRSGIPDTPMPPTPSMSETQALAIVAYLRSMPESVADAVAAGNAERGREIFTGSGKCLDCHRVAGHGSRLGPDLSRIGLDRGAADLKRSLLDPDAEVQPESRFYTVTPKRGKPVTGRLLNHDTFTVQLIDENEQLRSFEKSELAGFGFAESPMPSYRDKLDTQAIADVVSFLVTLRGEPGR